MKLNFVEFFTDFDKRRVMEGFLGNEEVLFFIYGVLFPNSAIKLAYGEDGEEDEGKSKEVEETGGSIKLPI